MVRFRQYPQFGATNVNRVSLGIVLGGAAVGLVGGALLPLPVYRLSVPWEAAPESSAPLGSPATPAPGPSRRDRCAGCDRVLAPGVPGWVRLGGRCAGCAVRLGPPAWLLAGLGAAGAAGVAWRVGAQPALAPYLFGVLVGLLLGTVDVLAQRLPHIVVYPAIAGAALLFAGVAVLERDAAGLLRAVLAAGALYLVYLIMAVLPGAPIGGGDLGLAAFLGLFLGWAGWPVVILGAALPWVLQAGVSVAVLVRRRGGARTMVAFGPSMLAGAYLVLVIVPAAVAVMAP
jgi:leader peptidase (prepilin peptidase)/N-methyltransferase